MNSEVSIPFTLFNYNILRVNPKGDLLKNSLIIRSVLRQ